MAISFSPEQHGLAASALAGDDEALGQLLTSHQRAAYNLAYRLLGRDADARDAVQEAFLLATRAVRGGAPPRQTDRFGAWLLRIVSNAALGQLRRRPRHRPLSADELAGVLPAPERNEPSRVLEGREARGDVLRALLSLPANQRAALTLREYEGLSYEEIATTLGLSRSAVETLLFRARREFRAAYEGLVEAARPVGCPELGPLLSAMLDSELDAVAFSRVSGHLEQCARCRRELSLLRRARRLHAGIPLLAPPIGWQAVPTVGSVVLSSAAGVVPAAPPVLGGAVAKLAGLLGAKLLGPATAVAVGATVLAAPAVADITTAHLTTYTAAELVEPAPPAALAPPSSIPSAAELPAAPPSSSPPTSEAAAIVAGVMPTAPEGVTPASLSITDGPSSAASSGESPPADAHRPSVDSSASAAPATAEQPAEPIDNAPPEGSPGASDTDQPPAVASGTGSPGGGGQDPAEPRRRSILGGGRPLPGRPIDTARHAVAEVIQPVVDLVDEPIADLVTTAEAVLPTPPPRVEAAAEPVRAAVREAEQATAPIRSVAVAPDNVVAAIPAAAAVDVSAVPATAPTGDTVGPTVERQVSGSAADRVPSSSSATSTAASVVRSAAPQPDAGSAGDRAVSRSPERSDSGRVGELVGALPGAKTNSDERDKAEEKRPAKEAAPTDPVKAASKAASKPVEGAKDKVEPKATNKEQPKAASKPEPKAASKPSGQGSEKKSESPKEPVKQAVQKVTKPLGR